MSNYDNTPTFDPEHEDPRSAQMAAAMRAEGVDPYEKVQVDFFAATQDYKTILSDGASYVTHKSLMEGDRKRYLRVIQRDLKIQKGTGDAIMKLAAGEDRTELLRVGITGWNLVRNGAPWAFNPRNLEEFVTAGPPAVLDRIEKDIKKNNPWLFAEATLEDIDEEIERLTELRGEVAEREAGNAGSAK